MIVMITKPSWWSGWFPLRWSRWSGRRSPLSVLWPAPPPSSCTKLALRVHNGPSCVNGWNILAPNSPAKMLPKKLDSLCPHHLDHSDGRLKLRKYWNSLRKLILFLREGAKGVGVISYLPYFLVSTRELSKKLSQQSSSCLNILWHSLPN